MGSVVDDAHKEKIELLDSQKKIEEEKNYKAENEGDESDLKPAETDLKSAETDMKKYGSVVFVLGGPGGGKSTQCAQISQQIGFTHLSSGGLLRKASESDPDHGSMIKRMIKEGESVPPELTMVILMKAIEESGNDKFILDGFPRDEEIRIAFETATKTEPELVLFFDCSEEEREKRILARNQGRVDDNPESIRKRFKYFEEHTLPVVEYYRSRGKVYQIDASRTKEEVSEIIKTLLTKTVVQLEGAEAEVEVEVEVEVDSAEVDSAEVDSAEVEVEVDSAEVEVEVEQDLSNLKL